MRLTASGALDTTFGDAGIVGTFGPEPLSNIEGIGLDSSGRIVFGGRVAGSVVIGHLAP